MIKWTTAAITAVLVCVVLPSAAVAQRCPIVSAKIARQNAENRKQVNRLLHDPDYTPTIRTYRADPTRFRGFDGFQTSGIACRAVQERSWGHTRQFRRGVGVSWGRFRSSRLASAPAGTLM